MADTIEKSALGLDLASLTRRKFTRSPAASEEQPQGDGPAVQGQRVRVRPRRCGEFAQRRLQNNPNELTHIAFLRRIRCREGPP
jgi:hypothetical protein